MFFHKLKIKYLIYLRHTCELDLCLFSLTSPSISVILYVDGDFLGFLV